MRTKWCDREGLGKGTFAAIAAGTLGGIANLLLGGCGGGAFGGPDGGHSEDAEVEGSTDAATLYVNRPDATADVAVCDPTVDPKIDPCVLDDAYGVFVASPVADDGGAGGLASDAGSATDGGTIGDGSASHPFSTIGAALDHLAGKSRIYVCSGLYAEEVSVTTAVSLFGGLTCANGAWTYDGSLAEVRSPSTQSLVVDDVGSGTVTIEDMVFASRDANSSDPPGTSSIAAFVAASTVNLRRVTLVAGAGSDGAAGADGAANPNYTTAAATNGNSPDFSGTGLDGEYSCPCSAGAASINTCTRHGSSTGGAGGSGCQGLGLASAGQSQPSAPSAPGRDGLPVGYVFPDGGINAATDPGADGLAGAAGLGAAAQNFGGLIAPAAWLPSPGGDGAPGEPGQGGAGGTDPLYMNCGESLTAGDIDPGGGGGAAGGCGGSGGSGGGGGGASIALATAEGFVDLKECSLVSGPAGAGGAGGAGQNGQAGGSITIFRGFENGPESPGGAGGNGGGGSGGAGGTGGVSAGIVYQGTQLTYDAATFAAIALGAPGIGGLGGAAGVHRASATFATGNDGSHGAPGMAGTSIAVLKAM
jgi:hypothetical protein